MAPELATTLGPLSLRTPLIAASGTVGSVVEWASVVDMTPYGAAVAKSVAPDPWDGRPPPRVAPIATGMLNGVGIQNPGIHQWMATVGSEMENLDVQVWGSAVAHDTEGFATVSKLMDGSDIAAVEVNLSCPNLDDGVIFSSDPSRSAAVIEAVAESTRLPVGAKISPNTPDIVGVSRSCVEAGADFLVLTNTTLGFGVDVADAKPLLSGGIGGYSGPGLKPIALRCVYEVARALPEVPIVGCGGVATGSDVAEFLMAGASAVAAGTVHLAEPSAGSRIMREFQKVMSHLGVVKIEELIGTVGSW